MHKVLTFEVPDGPAIALPTTEDALRFIWQAQGTMEQQLTPEQKFRVVLFGSARVPETDPVYRKYMKLGFEIARRRIAGVTGGGPGMMEAFNKGIAEGWASIGEPGYNHGVCITGINRNEKPNDFLKQAYQHGHVLPRLHQFVRLGYWGVVVLAEKAGFGTDLEKALFHQLLQFRQLHIPLIAIGPMWEERRAWEKKWIVDQGLADPHDLDYMQCVSSTEDALSIILDAHEKYQIAKSKAAG